MCVYVSVGAITWIAQHQDDADIDQPYMVRKRDTIPKIPLTAEERAVKLEAMRIRIQQRRQEKAVQEKVYWFVSIFSWFVSSIIHCDASILIWYLDICSMM